MIVKCVARENAELDACYIDEAMGLGRDAVFEHLEVGREYVVYAMVSSKDGVFYYVYELEDVPYPYARPAPLFEIVDPAPSKYWQVVFDRERNRLTLAFEEWFSDSNFYDRLTDWEEAKSATFREIKKRMDEEAGR